MKSVVIALLIGLLMVSWTCAADYPGRKGVLHRLALVKLGQSPAYQWRTSDCSFHVWDLVSRCMPEMRAYRWFARTNAATMALWPWPRVHTAVDGQFGDLMFFRSPTGRGIDHVGLYWTDPGWMVHASKSRGFRASELGPYWFPRLDAVTRPPY